MEIIKELKDISWQVDEPTYRADPALSYSTLAKYERDGFDKLDKLFEHISTPSLTEGSAVDAIITGGEEEFNANFTVLDINLTDGGKDTCQQLLAIGLPFNDFSEIPEEIVSNAAKAAGFWQADKWDKVRYKKVLETGNIAEYYNAMLHSNKTILNTETFQQILAMVRALRESPATAGYFADNDELSPVRRYYQLKFKATFEGVKYRIMADDILVDYERKVIWPTDLKTSGKAEWNFEHSFLQWSYMIQSRLYWRVIKANLMKDSYFKDFTLMPYRFIVVNKHTLTPLVWEFPLTKTVGTLVDEDGNEYRDPFEIGKELQGYLNLRPQVPNGITMEGVNTINCLKQKV
jgi:hypothetical protein